jgi:RND family efflux transporter MFP subunit
MTPSIAVRSTIFLGCAALLTAGVSCDDSKAAPASQPSATTVAVDVHVVPLAHDPFPDTVDFTGTLYGDEEAQIASKASGRIIEIAADMGDRLDDGALIARVDPTDYDLSIRQREAALNEALSKIGLARLPPADFDVTTVATARRAKVQADNAKARLDRAKQLFDQAQPLISPQEYADTETQYAVAQQDFDVAVLEVKSELALAQSRAADLVAARQQLADTRIVAPQSGPTSRPAHWAVAERHTSVGEYVTAGTVIYKLIADQPIKLRTAIPERYLNRIVAGQPVALYVDSSDKPTTGEVSRVSPAVDVASRTFMVEVTFANADRKLKPGSFGRGTIIVGTRTDVTTLPSAALYSFAGLDKVFTLKDGKAVSHTVNVVQRGKDKVVVETDLGGAKEAIVGGFARLATGVPVNVK